MASRGIERVIFSTIHGRVRGGYGRVARRRVAAQLSDVGTVPNLGQGDETRHAVADEEATRARAAQ